MYIICKLNVFSTWQSKKNTRLKVALANKEGNSFCVYAPLIPPKLQLVFQLALHLHSLFLCLYNTYLLQSIRYSSSLKLFDLQFCATVSFPVAVKSDFGTC